MRLRPAERHERQRTIAEHLGGGSPEPEQDERPECRVLHEPAYGLDPGLDHRLHDHGRVLTKAIEEPRGHPGHFCRAR